jgi:hypothetical protein
MIAINEQFVTDTSGATTGVLIAKEDYDRLVEYIRELEQQKEQGANSKKVKYQKLKDLRQKISFDEGALEDLRNASLL